MNVIHMIVIRDLDLACDTSNELAAFMVACRDHMVQVDITSSEGLSGYPVATFWAEDREGMEAVLLMYCGGDARAAQAIIDEQLTVDQHWSITTGNG